MRKCLVRDAARWTKDTWENSQLKYLSAAPLTPGLLDRLRSSRQTRTRIDTAARWIVLYNLPSFGTRGAPFGGVAFRRRQESCASQAGQKAGNVLPRTCFEGGLGGVWFGLVSPPMRSALVLLRRPAEAVDSGDRLWSPCVGSALFHWDSFFRVKVGGVRARLCTLPLKDCCRSGR